MAGKADVTSRDANHLRATIIRRPSSLRELVEWACRDDNFNTHLSDFLHEFKRRPDFEMVREAPEPMQDHFNDGGWRDAYLSAVAAYLARQIGREVPRWALSADRFLASPWFAEQNYLPLKLRLLIESPPEFRERNLFVSENAMDVY